VISKIKMKPRLFARIIWSFPRKEKKDIFEVGVASESWIFAKLAKASSVSRNIRISELLTYGYTIFLPGLQVWFRGDQSRR